MKIPMFKIYWDERDISGVNDIISRGSMWANGPEIQLFENEIANYVGANHVLTFNSGTSALHAALLAHGMKEGDEVIVPSFTFNATANAAMFVGAKPVFAEIEDRTYGLDPEDVKERITSRTKAIIPIHYGGGPCSVRELKEIAEDSSLVLIEDAAESMGAKVDDQMVGTFGNSAILSFCQNKIISTGEGGAIITNSSEIYEQLKLIRSHGRLETQDYFSSIDPMEYICLGYNFRMPTMNAALGLSQMEKIDRIIKLRRKAAEAMKAELSNVQNVSLLEPPPNHFHVCQMFTIRVDPGIRDTLSRELAKRDIMNKVYFSPVHLTQFYRNEFGYTDGSLPITESISSSVLSLPIYASLKNEEIKYICDNVKDIMETFE